MQRDHTDDPRYPLAPTDGAEKLAILPDGLLMRRSDLTTMVHPVLLFLRGLGSVRRCGGRGRGGGVVDLALGGVFEGGFGGMAGFEGFVFL